MLESASLLIQPWALGDGKTWRRAVADGSTSAGLGMVRCAGPAAQGWLSWLRGHRLEVLETDDAALLMTLLQPWRLSRRWDVYDAEERRAGTVYPPVLFDSDGGRRGRIEPDGAAQGRVLNPSSQLLARYERRTDGATLMQFASDLEANPFLRMLLLGGVLAQDPLPKQAA